MLPGGERDLDKMMPLYERARGPKPVTPEVRLVLEAAGSRLETPALRLPKGQPLGPASRDGAGPVPCAPRPEPRLIPVEMPSPTIEFPRGRRLGRARQARRDGGGDDRHGRESTPPGPPAGLDEPRPLAAEEANQARILAVAPTGAARTGGAEGHGFYPKGYPPEGRSACT